MAKIKGPAIFIVQFMRDEEPFNNIKGITKWASDLGYVGVQIPTWEPRAIDLDRAAESKTYCDEYKGTIRENGVDICELGSYIEGQMLAIPPGFDVLFQPFYPEGLNDRQRVEWATGRLKKSIRASVNLETRNISVMSGGFAWHTVYPWPQRPAGLIEESFTELARRWKPLLDMAGENGITFGYELHPVSDLHDGATYEMFLEKVDKSPAACITYDPSHFLLQQLDYCAFIEIYGERIRAFHVKDAEFRPTGRVGVYGGYQSWVRRAGRFRSLGDGQVDFTRIFTLLTEAGYDGWAILEWECAVKSSAQGAREGAPFIARHIIEATEVAFDDFAGGKADRKTNRKILGLD
jgi:sugar phosphate isomerase/epimerase